MNSVAFMLNQQRLFEAVAGNAFWESYLVSTIASRATRLHLAVFVEPYLRYILQGSKTVESRFSRNDVAPYRRVGVGDVILLKRTGRDVEAVCRAADAWFYELQPSSWKEIRERFMRPMRVSHEFLAGRSNALYATLIRLDEVCPIVPIRVRKTDRRGWVVLRDPFRGTSATDTPAEAQLTLGV